MSTYTWSIPAGKEITGSTYLKDTDNYLGDTINDLVDFVNGEGLHENKGMTYDFVDKASDQTITGVKTFTQPIVGNINTATKLQTPRKINGVDFDGTTNITILDDTKLSISTGTTDLTSITTPTNADELVIADSTSSFSLKKLSFANLKATLLTYFDTLYSRTSAVFGIGQTWQNVKASRALGVTYTNSTGKPIVITATISGEGAGSTTAIGLVNGAEIIRSWASYTTSGPATGAMVTFVVPIGSTYLVDSMISGPVQQLYAWTELR